MIVYHWLGGEVLTAFEQQRLFDQTGVEVQAFDYYCLVSLETLGLTERVLIEDMLKARYIAKLTMISPKAQKCWVMPKRNTVSVWSSQIQAYFKLFKIKHIQQIEQGHVYVAETLTPTLLRELYHDNKEILLTTPEQVEQYFSFIDNEQRQEIINYSQRHYWSLKRYINREKLPIMAAELKSIYKQQQKNKLVFSAAHAVMLATANMTQKSKPFFDYVWLIQREAEQGNLAKILQENNIEYNYTCTHSVNNYRYSGAKLAIAQGAFNNTLMEGLIALKSASPHQHQPKMFQPLAFGLCLSDLALVNYPKDWELVISPPRSEGSPLTILNESLTSLISWQNSIDAPVLLGFLRTFTQRLPLPKKQHLIGYHHPLRYLATCWQVEENIKKVKAASGQKIVLLGSLGSDQFVGRRARVLAKTLLNAESLARDQDYQEIDAAAFRQIQNVLQEFCGKNTTAADVIEVRDVGPGGLGDAIWQFLSEQQLGADIDIRELLDKSYLTPLALWSHETGMRVLIICRSQGLAKLKALAKRERINCWVLGDTVETPFLTVGDRFSQEMLIQTSISQMLSATPSLTPKIKRRPLTTTTFHLPEMPFGNIVKRLLTLPSIADKRFLITALDRMAGGYTRRDQLVGPYQIPVADNAVIAKELSGPGVVGMSVGERPLLALIHPAAAMRMAIAEAITNIAGLAIANLDQIECRITTALNSDVVGEVAAMSDVMRALPAWANALGIKIRDHAHSENAIMRWRADNKRHEMMSPLSIVVHATAAVQCRQMIITPLCSDEPNTELWLVDLGKNQCRLGGSALCQVMEQLGDNCPDVDEVADLKRFFNFIQKLHQEKMILAYHDRSDGGLLVTLTEMAFTRQNGLHITIAAEVDPITFLCHEEVGVVIQTRHSEQQKLLNIVADYQLENGIQRLGRLFPHPELIIQWGEREFYRESLAVLMQWWSECGYKIRCLRDNPVCAEEEYLLQGQETQPRIYAEAYESFYAAELFHIGGNKPRLAILREQGSFTTSLLQKVFTDVGFDVSDVHSTDLESGEMNLSDYQGLVIGGGASFSDNLAPGRAWSLLLHQQERTQKMLQEFFARTNTFTLGIGNGAQVLSYLKDWIPGAEHWPQFCRNHSKQKEARWVMVKIESSPSLLLNNMAGMILPVWVAHQHGNIMWPEIYHEQACLQQKLTGLCYVDHQGKSTSAYPFNPSGSVGGMTGFSSRDGRALILMTHPELSYLQCQLSWSPFQAYQSPHTPWQQLFINARKLF